MKIALFAAAAVIAMKAAFNNDASEICEVVTVVVDGNEVRVNKSDYDADQNKPAAERVYGKLAPKKVQDETEQPVPAGQPVVLPEGVVAPPAPSAPVFNTETADGTPVPGDPVPPTSPSPGQLGYIPKGTGAKERFYVVDLSTGQEVVKDGIDPAGYKTPDAAIEAIQALPH